MSEFIVPNSVRDRLETLTARRRDVWIVAAFLALVAIGGFALWSRGGTASVAPPATAPPAAAPPATAPPSTTRQSDGSNQSAGLYVHVAGGVRRPGLYSLPEGARVADALEVARGPIRRADLDLINLAQPVADGMQVYVPRRGESAPVAGAASSSSPERGGPLVDVNTADEVALEAIPGIGPVKAAAIIEYRESAGRFDSVEELLQVNGIGPATLESMRAYVTVG